MGYKKGRLGTDFVVIGDSQMKALSAFAGLVFTVALLSNARAQDAPPFLFEGWHQVAPLSMRFQVYHNRVIAFENLSQPCGEGADGSMGDVEPITGRVVGRQFAQDQMTLTGFVLELQDGERQFINVDTMISLDQFSVDRASRTWVISGLQRMLNVNNVITGTVQYCAGSGHIAVLNSLNSSGSLVQ